MNQFTKNYTDENCEGFLDFFFPKFKRIRRELDAILRDTFNLKD